MTHECQEQLFQMDFRNFLPGTSLFNDSDRWFVEEDL